MLKSIDIREKIKEPLEIRHHDYSSSLRDSGNDCRKAIGKSIGTLLVETRIIKFKNRIDAACIRCQFKNGNTIEFTSMIRCNINLMPINIYLADRKQRYDIRINESMRFNIVVKRIICRDEKRSVSSIRL